MTNAEKKLFVARFLDVSAAAMQVLLVAMLFAQVLSGGDFPVANLALFFSATWAAARLL